MKKESNKSTTGCFVSLIIFLLVLFLTPVIPLLIAELPTMIEYELGRGERIEKHKEYLKKQQSLILPRITTEGLIADLEKNWGFRFEPLNSGVNLNNPDNLKGVFKRLIINNDLDLTADILILQDNHNDILSIEYSANIYPPLLLIDAFAENDVPYQFFTNAPLETLAPAERVVFLQWIKSEISTISNETDSTIKIDDINYSIKVGSSTKYTYSGPTKEKKYESTSKYTYVRLSIKK